MKASNDFSSMTLAGYVTEYDPTLHAARVYFPDKDITSGWLQIIVSNALCNHDEVHVDVNEHVVCLMLGNGLEAGFILGSIYDETNKPVVSNQDIRVIKFEDGTSLQYDRSNHKMLIDCTGDIDINAKGNIRLQATRIDLN